MNFADNSSALLVQMQNYIIQLEQQNTTMLALLLALVASTPDSKIFLSKAEVAHGRDLLPHKGVECHGYPECTHAEGETNGDAQHDCSKSGGLDLVLSDPPRITPVTSGPVVDAQQSKIILPS